MADIVDGYKDLDSLAKRLQKALAELRPKESAPQPTTSSLAEPLGASGGAQAGGGVPLRSGGAEDGQKPSRPDYSDPLREGVLQRCFTDVLYQNWPRWNMADKDHGGNINDSASLP